MMTDTGIISKYQSGVDVIFEWKIGHFSTLKERDRTCYYSPEFSYGGETWFLGILPNGSRWNNSSGHLDLFLRKCSSCHSIRQSFSISLKTAKVEKYNEQHWMKNFGKGTDYHEFSRFIQRSELTRKSSELMPEGVLSVVCTMKNMTSATSNSNTASPSAECRFCKGTFNADSMSLHQKKCMHRPIKCPDCLAVVILEKWLNEHDCQQERLAGNSDSDSVEHSSDSDTDSAESSSDSDSAESSSNSNSGECCHKCSNCLAIIKKLKLLEELENQKKRYEAEKSENICVETSTHTGEENTDEWFKEKSRNVSAEASTQTEEHNVDEWFKEKSRNVCVDASTQIEKQNVSLISLPKEHDLMTDVKNLLKEGRGIDVTFELEIPNGKTEFFAHQLILALRSPYFANLFYRQGSNRGHQIIPLKGINTKAFKQMIRYCYDYKPCLRTTDDACALFKVAFEFKVTSLQKLCHTLIKDSKIEPGTVFSILKISEKIGDKSLEDMCYKIIQEKTREVVAAYELCDVTPSMVHTILDLPTLSLNSEYELIRWLFDWAKVKSGDKDSSFENAREYLEKLLQDMNFLALTFEEFAMLCRDFQDFFDSDEIASVSLNIAFPEMREMPDWYNKDLKCRAYTGSKH